MSADLQKARFGARPQRRWLYLQPTDSYQADVLNQLTEAVLAAAPCRRAADPADRVVLASASPQGAPS
jgi:hypothetical protein